MIFKDPNQIKRAATKIAWHPDQTELRVGVTYAMLRFQQMPKDMPRESYIWNLNNPNFPEKTLLPSSPLCCMSFNNKSPEIIVGGSYNGSICFFDTRQGNSSGVIKPFKTSILEKSHHDPVYSVEWVVCKTGTECVSSSTDGRVLWWDWKESAESPAETLIINESFPGADPDSEPKNKVLGATSMCYNQDAGPLKYLLGTEQGYIMQAQKRKTIDIQQRFGFDGGKHHGPVYSISRNPGHSKYFLSVGDWSAKIWTEELKSPIMQTRYHSAYLTDGCWSTTRPGLFYLTRIDGFLDVWDFYYRQNESAYSQKISDSPLTSIAINQNMAAIGDAEGTVSIIQLCKPLFEVANKEKEVMQQIFEREFRREKNLEIAKRVDPKAAKKAAQQKQVDPEKEKAAAEERMKTKLQTIDEKFFSHIAKDEGELNMIKARGEANMQEEQATPSKAVENRIDLAEGSYSFDAPDGTHSFKVEAGGIIAGDNCNGSVQAGKLILNMNGIDYEGTFVSPTSVEATWTNASGEKGECIL